MNPRYFDYEGRLWTLGEAGKHFGYTYEQLYARIHTHGWSFEEAVSKPIRQSPGDAEGERFRKLLDSRGLTVKGLTKTVPLSESGVGEWLRRGVTPRYAYHVAELLSCKPYEISKVYHA